MHNSELDGSQKRPLRERLLDRSRLARERARDIPDGAERERLLNNAQHCDTAAEIAELLDGADNAGLCASQRKSAGG
jgi:hypothetical protein